MVEETLNRMVARKTESIADVLEIDRAGREVAQGIVQQQRVTARPMTMQASIQEGI